MLLLLATITVFVTQYAMRKRIRPVQIVRELNLMPALTVPSSIGRALAERKNREVFVVSFPKSGTHLCSFAVWLLTTGRRDLDENFHEKVQVYELNKHWKAEDERAPNTLKNRFGGDGRIFFSHLRPEVLLSRASPRCRYIYVIRRVEDVVKSYYTMLTSFTREYGGFEGNLEDFARAFVDGRLNYGDYLDHLEAWFEAERGDIHKRILIVRYEHLAGTREEVAGVLERINDRIFFDPGLPRPYPARHDIEHPDSPLLEMLSFEWMKRNAELFQTRTKMARSGGGEKFTIINEGGGRNAGTGGERKKLSHEASEILSKGLERRIEERRGYYSKEFLEFLREFVVV